MRESFFFPAKAESQRSLGACAESHSRVSRSVPCTGAHHGWLGKSSERRTRGSHTVEQYCTIRVPGKGVLEREGSWALLWNGFLYLGREEGQGPLTLPVKLRQGLNSSVERV